MRTQKQIEASRANGRRSRGPVTPEGKRISSQNARTHGILAGDALVLKGEYLECYHQTLDSLLRDFPPLTPEDEILLHEAAFSLGHTRRAIAMQTAALAAEQRRWQNESPDGCPMSPGAADWRAFAYLCRHSGLMNALERYEVHHHLRFHRAFHRLRCQQEERDSSAASRSPKAISA